MKKGQKKLIIFAAIILVLVVLVTVSQIGGPESYAKKYEGTDLSVDAEVAAKSDSYANYLNSHKNAAEPANDIDIDLLSYVNGNGVAVVENLDGVDKALMTENESEVTWIVDVPESGFYNLELLYHTVESRGVPVERAVYIDGKAPFLDATDVPFSRIWTNGGPVREDNRGNQIRPIQKEVYTWQTAFFRDDMGYVTEPYKFYLEKGKREITIKAVNEPVVIGKITVKAISKTPTYDEYRASVANKVNNASGKSIVQKVQGEDSTIRSDSSLYAKYDKSSATTSPYSVTKTLLNYVGGEQWKSSSQWIEWDFEVPEDGFYNITIKGRQSYARGAVASRILSIDGVVPFEEAKDVSFDYDVDWDVKTLKDKDGNPYEFYLTKGTHTMRLEATLSGMGPILEELSDSVYRLNMMYKTLLVYTGASPDKYRDYKVEVYYPEIITAMELEYKRLYRIIDETSAYTGQKADKIGQAVTLAMQLERFVEKPFKITSEFGTFKDNITSVGTAILDMSETKLDIDYFVVTSSGDKVPKDKNNIFKKAWHSVKSFVATYIVDYDAVGDVYDTKNDKVLTVWVTTNRDESTILKTLIDETFTKNTGVKVNLQIVAADVLLGAVVAGQGPDVVLSVGSNMPVDYALRGSAVDLSQFEGVEEVLAQFHPSAYESFKFNGGLYGLPQSQTFDVLFYRTDILEELELEIPNTWDDVIGMLPTIQGNNMEFGIPTITTVGAADASLFYTLLYQNGGQLYDADAKTTTIDSEEGVKAFELYTRFFNDYGMPLAFDFVSRFRSGQMPIAISNFGTYNTLVVSAPEIRGLWDFTILPATVRGVDENGNQILDRSVHSVANCCMMIETDDEEIKQMGWKFMKWLVSTETQVNYGREMEALLGSSARYASANVEAFSQLSWTAHAIEVLSEQRKSCVGYREVAGGYYTSRHVVNAARKVLNEKEDPRETLLDYAITIDEELTKKRKEFGLPVAE